MSQNNQQSYQTGNYGGGSGEMAPVMTMGDWVKTLLLLIIPIVNIVLLIVWAASSDAGNNPNRRNWARAQLIMMAIGVVLWIILVVIMGAIGATLFNSGMYY